MTTDMNRYRIKKGVSPYGGRIFPGVPDGDGRTVTIYVATATANKNRGLGGDPRTYRLDEVEEVKRPR
jgi:hypothetical protein